MLKGRKEKNQKGSETRMPDAVHQQPKSDQEIFWQAREPFVLWFIPLSLAALAHRAKQFFDMDAPTICPLIHPAKLGRFC
jgi:hypothetical protein